MLDEGGENCWRMLRGVWLVDVISLLIGSYQIKGVPFQRVGDRGLLFIDDYFLKGWLSGI